MRFLPLLADLASQVTVVAGPALAPLVPAVDRRLAWQAAPDTRHCDMRVSLRDLPALVHPAVQPFGTGAYLHVPNAQIEARELLVQRVARGRPRVALSLAPHLSELADDLLATPGVAWFELAGFDQRARSSQAARRGLPAAFVECLDLVVTTDHALASLGGALGKQVWLPVGAGARPALPARFSSIKPVACEPEPLLRRLRHWYNDHVDALVASYCRRFPEAAPPSHGHAD